MRDRLARAWRWAIAWGRPQRWGLIVSALALLSNLLLFGAVERKDPASDGHYTWLFARSLAYDGDIDFTNDYALCGDPYHHNVNRGGGHPDNPFYVGPSIFWVPVLLAERAVLRTPPGTPDNVARACRGPLAQNALGIGAFAGALAIYLAYCASRRLADDFVAALVAGLFAFGTTLSSYATVWSHYAHVYDTAAAAIVLVLSLRAAEEPHLWRRWVLAGIALAASVLMRPTNAVFGLVPLCAAIGVYRHDRRRLALRVAIVAGAAILLGLLPQLRIYKYLYGTYLALPQGRYYLQPLHAHPWLLLFAPKGLLFMAPAAWLSIAGVCLVYRRHPLRATLIGVAIVSAVTVWVSSTPLDWNGSTAIGARRLLSLIPMMAFLAARPAAAIAAWISARRARMEALLLSLILLPVAFLFLGTTLGIIGSKVNVDRTVSQADTYGGATTAAWATLDQQLGELAVLPAQIVFALRYGLPMSSYGEVLSVDRYIRNYATMRLHDTILDTDVDHIRKGMRGFVPGPDGHMALVKKRGTLLVATHWPYATQVIVRGTAHRAVDLKVGSCTFFGFCTTYGTAHLEPDQDAAEKVAIPKGGFDSGLNELFFESPDDDAVPTLRSLELVDETRWAPPM